MLTSADVLGPGGIVAKRLPDFEFRPEQLEMATAVASAFERREHLLVEAGTGVGKSFAYLLPAIQAVAERQQRVLISTHTIALQEQLIEKDIPFLQEILPFKFSAVLVKGRNNYVGLRRLAAASKRQDFLFAGKQREELWRIEDWAYRTRDGSLADLESQPDTGVWEKVRSEHGNCMGRRCPTYEKCFYQRARRRAENARLLIVNHALFLSDLALQSQKVRLLPPYGLVIIDEAHTLDRVGSEYFGAGVSNGQVYFLLNGLFSERERGFLASCQADEAIQAVRKTRKAAQRFFAELVDWQRRRGRPSGRVMAADPVPNTLSPALKKLVKLLGALRDRITDKQDRFELNSFIKRAKEQADLLEELLGQKRDDAVHWIETSGQADHRIALKCAPINIGERLHETLFSKVESCVLTSATLSTGGADGNQDLSYIRDRLGIEEAVSRKLPSSFAFAKQVELHIQADMPNPSGDPAFLDAACENITKYVKMTRGKAFVLFTSYAMLHAAADRLGQWFTEHDIELLVHGQGMGRTEMLDRFRRDTDSVLFGTESFWHGVDVAGEALSNVIIVKLPFEAPDRPLVEARCERMRAEGRSPFMDYQLPEAVLRFRQGFGRLIRRKTDRGIVVVLDPRILRKSYGKRFLDSLPECPVLIHPDRIHPGQ